MTQYIYSIGALAGVMLLSVMINGGRTFGERRIYVNEVTTQMMGVAEGVIDVIDSPNIHFDSKTAGLRAYEASVDSLTYPDAFGGCDTVSSCTDVDDFDGLSLDVTRQGFTYTASITVNYVSRTNSNEIVTTPTMSKLVTVKVETTSALTGNQPLSVEVSRVIGYH